MNRRALLQSITAALAATVAAPLARFVKAEAATFKPPTYQNPEPLVLADGDWFDVPLHRTFTDHTRPEDVVSFWVPNAKLTRIRVTAQPENIVHIEWVP